MMQRKTTAVCLVCASALLLSACSALTTHSYERPAVGSLPQWQNLPATATAQTVGMDRWWQSFGDAQLNALIAEVLQNNNDLAAAGITVRKAWLQAGLAADKEMPVLSGEIDTTQTRTKNNGMSTRSMARSSRLGVSYEVDLWGRLSSAHDAASWEARASEEDRANTAWALVSTTAKLYWQIAYLNERIRLSADNIAYAKQILQIVQAKYAAGAVSPLDVSEAEQTLASQQANHADLLQQRVVARNAMSILFNAPPGAYAAAEANSLSRAALPVVDAGLPADLLGRRPDLRAAEMRLRETLASADASTASYYPKLSLTGSLGSSSPALGNLLQNPVTTLGAGLVLPFLQWNEMQLTRKSAEADYEKAVINFRQTLYSAMADVENALSARAQYLEQSAALEKSLAAAQRSVAINSVRYQSGAIALKILLDSQQTQREAEVSLLQNRYNRYVNHATLCQALGGATQIAKRP